MNNKKLKEVLYQMRMDTINPELPTVNRAAKDINDEVNRVKRESRKLTKYSKDVLNAIEVSDENGLPLKSQDVSRESVDEQLFFLLLASDIMGGVELSEDLEEALGLELDYTKLSVWNVRYIRWQIAAQIFWYNNPNMKFGRCNKS